MLWQPPNEDPPPTEVRDKAMAVPIAVVTFGHKAHQHLMQQFEAERDAARAAVAEQQGRRFLARWRNATLVRIVQAWRDDTREELRKRRAMAKFVAQMRNRGVARSMASWHEYVTLRKRARKAMQWMLSRLVKEGLVKGWSTWRAFVSHARAESIRGAQRDALSLFERERSRACAREAWRLIDRWRDARILPAWTMWRRR